MNRPITPRPSPEELVSIYQKRAKNRLLHLIVSEGMTDEDVIKKLDLLPVGWEVFKAQTQSMDEILLAAAKLGFIHLFQLQYVNIECFEVERQSR